jgi:hypothetical protein
VLLADMGTPSLALSLPPVAPIEPAVGHKRPTLQPSEQNGTPATTPQKKSRPANGPYALVQADEEIRYAALPDCYYYYFLVSLLVLIVCAIRSLKRKTPVHDTVTSRRRMPMERINAALIDEFAKESMLICYSVLSSDSLTLLAFRLCC